MATHVRILGILHIVLGSIGILIGLGLFAFFGGLAALVGFQEHGPDALIPTFVLTGVGGFILIVLLVLSVPGIIAGIGLLNRRPWARVLTIVLSVLNLFHVPFGTALGVYGLVVMFQPETESLFRQGHAPAPVV